MAAEHSLRRIDAQGHNESAQDADGSTARITVRAPVSIPAGKAESQSDDTPRAIYREDLAQFRARVKAYQTLKEQIGPCYQIRFEDYVRFEDFSDALDAYDEAKHEEFVLLPGGHS